MVKKILIINLTRMGDLIQTTALISGLKKKYSLSQIDYLAMSSFASILKNIPGLDEIITLDDHLLVDQLRDDIWTGYLEIKQKVDFLNRREYDLLITPVVSIQASMLSYLIKAKEKLGMITNSNREQKMTSDWTSYHLANEHHLGERCLNLVDIFSNIGGVSTTFADFQLQASTEALQRANSFWQDKNLHRTFTIGFHVGASQSNKAWEPEKFKQVIHRLLDDPGITVIIFGGYQELPLNNVFSDLKSNRLLNLINNFKVDELIAYIGKLNMFVTNDTGPMHIAAACKVPIINISLGPVSLWETGPYSQKALVLQANIDCHPCKFSYQCPHWNCHSMLTPSYVLAFILAYKCQLQNIQEWSYPAEDRVICWQSTQDIFGYQHFVPLRKRQITAQEYFFEIKRLVWILSLTGKSSNAEAHNQTYLDYLSKYYFLVKHDYPEHILLLEKLIKTNQQYLQEFESIFSMRHESKKSVDRIQFIWASVKKIKSDMFDSAKQITGYYDLFAFAQFKESKLSDGDFFSLLEETSHIYALLDRQLRIILLNLRR